jgi:hypothetical protein
MVHECIFVHSNGRGELLISLILVFILFFLVWPFDQIEYHNSLSFNCANISVAQDRIAHLILQTSLFSCFISQFLLWAFVLGFNIRSHCLVQQGYGVLSLSIPIINTCKHMKQLTRTEKFFHFTSHRQLLLTFIKILSFVLCWEDCSLICST